MTEAEIAKYIRQNDHAMLGERVAREKVLESLPCHDAEMMIPGGTIVLCAFTAARRAFVYGLWIPSLLSSFAALEQCMGALLHIIGIDEVKSMTFGQMIRKMNQLNRLVPGEADELKGLAQMLAIYRNFHSPMAFTRRCMETETEDGSIDFDLAMSVDAQKALEVTGRFFARHCAL